MLKNDEKRLLEYTPIGMNLDKNVGWGTLLFTNSRACNLSCDGCWTSTTNESIKQQLKFGADWMYNNSYGLNVLESILGKFKKENGKLVAFMSDGEPFVNSNYEFTFNLAESCGKQKLPLLLFSNGIYLDNKKLEEINKATNNRISYCISIQTGVKESYGNFMLIDKEDNPTGERIFETLEEKFKLWKEYDKRTFEKTGKHAIAIHT